MQINIPNVGDHLELNCDWDIGLSNNYDNSVMLERLGVTVTFAMEVAGTKTLTTIPKGAVLKIEQIYIRKGAADLSSLKFLWRNPPTGKSVRFRALLDDVNRMDCDYAVENK